MKKEAREEGAASCWWCRCWQVQVQAGASAGRSLLGLGSHRQIHTILPTVNKSKQITSLTVSVFNLATSLLILDLISLEFFIAGSSWRVRVSRPRLISDNSPHFISSSSCPSFDLKQRHAKEVGPALVSSGFARSLPLDRYDLMPPVSEFDKL
ncbi:hypothetical protein BKA60DRAFT_35118 [Fusarium oxysporum]|nr:hypothetical protein BKA60DRAFT_35118 [Fusarium oxysporum]